MTKPRCLKPSLQENRAPRGPQKDKQKVRRKAKAKGKNHRQEFPSMKEACAPSIITRVLVQIAASVHSRMTIPLFLPEEEPLLVLSKRPKETALDHSPMHPECPPHPVAFVNSKKELIQKARMIDPLAKRGTTIHANVVTNALIGMYQYALFGKTRPRTVPWERIVSISIAIPSNHHMLYQHQLLDPILRKHNQHQKLRPRKKPRPRQKADPKPRARQGQVHASL